jgi:hypothetical protein
MYAPDFRDVALRQLAEARSAVEVERLLREISAWLETPQARFLSYVAERERTRG